MLYGSCHPNYNFLIDRKTYLERQDRIWSAAGLAVLELGHDFLESLEQLMVVESKLDHRHDGNLFLAGDHQGETHILLALVAHRIRRMLGFSQVEVLLYTRLENSFVSKLLSLLDPDESIPVCTHEQTSLVDRFSKLLPESRILSVRTGHTAEIQFRNGKLCLDVHRRGKLAAH